MIIDRGEPWLKPGIEDGKPTEWQRRTRLGSWLTLLFVGPFLLCVVAVYFAVPLLATGLFSLWEGGDRYGLRAYLSLMHQAEVLSSLELSLRLAEEPILATLVILIPTVFWMHL